MGDNRILPTIDDRPPVQRPITEDELKRICGWAAWRGTTWALILMQPIAWIVSAFAFVVLGRMLGN